MNTTNPTSFIVAYNNQVSNIKAALASGVNYLQHNAVVDYVRNQQGVVTLADLDALLIYKPHYDTKYYELDTHFLVSVYVLTKRLVELGYNCNDMKNKCRQSLKKYDANHASPDTTVSLSTLNYVIINYRTDGLPLIINDVEILIYFNLIEEMKSYASYNISYYSTVMQNVLIFKRYEMYEFFIAQDCLYRDLYGSALNPVFYLTQSKSAPFKRNKYVKLIGLLISNVYQYAGDKHLDSLASSIALDERLVTMAIQHDPRIIPNLFFYLSSTKSQSLHRKPIPVDHSILPRLSRTSKTMHINYHDLLFILKIDGYWFLIASFYLIYNVTSKIVHKHDMQSLVQLIINNYPVISTSAQQLYDDMLPYYNTHDHDIASDIDAYCITLITSMRDAVRQQLIFGDCDIIVLSYLFTKSLLGKLKNEHDMS